MSKVKSYKHLWGYSSVVEHSTADRNVPSSNLGAPLKNGCSSLRCFKMKYLAVFCMLACLYGNFCIIYLKIYIKYIVTKQ